MRICLVTINYNGSDKTVRLLESLRAQSDQNFDVIVVDNASSEHDFRKLERGIEETFSSAGLIRNQENRGFSGGNNSGIKTAIQNGSEWVVLINNDTWVDSNFIARLGPILSQPEGILGLPVVEGNRTAYCGRIGWLKLTLPHIYDSVNHLPSTGNFYAIGAAMAVHKAVFEKIGFLDERYFLYFEDVDFTVRARKAGVPVNFAVTPAVNHEVSGTTSSMGAPLLLRYHSRNALLFNSLHAPLYIRIALPFLSFLAIIYGFLKIIFLPAKRPLNQAILSGIMDFYGGRHGRIQS